MFERTKYNIPKIDSYQNSIEINLREIARFHLDTPLITLPLCDTYINPFDPDSNEIQVFDTYYRDPATGQHGNTIKFIQKIKRLSDIAAIAYLEGFRDGRGQA